MPAHIAGLGQTEAFDAQQALAVVPAPRARRVQSQDHALPAGAKPVAHFPTHLAGLVVENLGALAEKIPVLLRFQQNLLSAICARPGRLGRLIGDRPTRA